MAKLIFTAVVFVAISCIFAKKEPVQQRVPKQNIQATQDDINNLAEKIHSIGSIVKKQEHVIAEQNKKIELQQKEINSQKKEMQTQAETIEQQEKSIDDLRQGILKETKSNAVQNQMIQQCFSQVEKRDKLFGKNYRRQKHGNDKIALYETSDLACLYDVVNLTCDAGSIVFVTSAVYGQYAEECDGGCCEPNVTTDCTVAMEDENTEDWINLRLACNYESSCSYQLQAHGLTSCPIEKFADYLMVSYSCYSDTFQSDPVAFTAYTTTTRSYIGGQRLTFEYTVSNLGGHYSVSNYTFVCPYDGLYVFYVNVMSDDVDYMIARIMMDGLLLVSAFADDISAPTMDNHAANMVFAECNAYQEVYVESDDSGSYMSSTTNRLSTFSGFLLTRY